MYPSLELLFLFLSALLAATILPMQSEIVLVGLDAKGDHSTAILLLVASVGNVLGSLINWLLGRYVMHFKDCKWFPVNAKNLKKAEAMYQKYGVWTLLLAWLPFIGDPLTIVAGMFKTNLWIFTVLVTLGKTTRYAVILAII